MRLEFVAGKAVAKVEKLETEELSRIAKELRVEKNQVPARAAELFSKWKKARKALKKKKPITKKDLELTSTEKSKGTDEELLEETAKTLQTQPQHVGNTIKRFLKEVKEMKKGL